MLSCCKLTSKCPWWFYLGLYGVAFLSKSSPLHFFEQLILQHFNFQLFAPYIMQPTRFASQSLIDNILINSIEYMSYSGNLTIQISHHLLQFVILESFFKEVLPKKINLYERNFNIFNEREFDEALKNCDYDSILALDQNDPNLSMENLYNNTIFLLDEFAPYRKLSKKDYKLKSKP